MTINQLISWTVIKLLLATNHVSHSVTVRPVCWLDITSDRYGCRRKQSPGITAIAKNKIREDMRYSIHKLLFFVELNGIATFFL